jgi:hypothetical protein
MTTRIVFGNWEGSVVAAMQLGATSKNVASAKARKIRVIKMAFNFMEYKESPK